MGKREGAGDYKKLYGREKRKIIGKITIKMVRVDQSRVSLRSLLQNEPWASIFNQDRLEKPSGYYTEKGRIRFADNENTIILDYVLSTLLPRSSHSLAREPGQSFLSAEAAPQREQNNLIPNTGSLYLLNSILFPYQTEGVGWVGSAKRVPVN